MANFSELRAEIKAQIKPNGEGAITGQVMQDTMLSVVDTTDAILTELSEEVSVIPIMSGDSIKNAVLNGYYNTSGQFVPNDTYKALPLLPNYNNELFIDLNVWKVISFNIRCLDKDKNYIGETIGKDLEGGVKLYEAVPNTAYYGIYWKPVDANTDYTAYFIEGLEYPQLANLSKKINDIEKGLNEELQGKAVSLELNIWRDGENLVYDSSLPNPSSAYDLFGPIFLQKGDILAYKTLCTAAIAELSKITDHLSASPSYVSLVKGRASYDENRYTIEEDGYYILCGRDAASYPDYVTTAYVIEKGIVDKVDALETEVAELRNAASIHDVLQGKKYVACGDSFTAYTNAKFESGIYQGRDKTYPYLIGLRTGMDVNNMAVSGMSLVKKDGSDNYFSGDYFKGIPSDADYITIKLGINDVNYGSPIGTINDSDNTTFYGAWNVVMSYLIANYPYAKIGIIVTNGASDEVMEAERAIAKKWGVPFLDYGDYQTPLMGRMSGFRDDVCSEALLARHNAFRISDTDTHPNAKAHEYESTFIEAFLRSL